MVDLPADLILADDLSLPLPYSVGGKGKHLLHLKQQNFQIPPFCIIPAEVCLGVLEGHLQVEAQLQALAACEQEQTALQEVSAELRRVIETISLPEEFEAALAEMVQTFSQQNSGNPCYLAVRSSAVDEDSAELSFAGLHDSYLFQRSVAQVQGAVRKVWASAYNQQALAYRLKHAGQQKIGLIPMAVVIQEMITAQTSGVCFTCHPATYDIHKVVISSLWGAGEGLVSQGFDADTFVVDKISGETSAEVTEKVEQMQIDQEAGYGLTKTQVPDERQNVSSLSEFQIQEVAKLAQKIEQHYRRPQDIEFCYDPSGKLYILQSRPVVNVPEYGPAAGNRLLWDNSNIIESYSGVTSPMTFSFIRRAYTIVYHCFAKVMGISAEVVRENRDTFENMLGLIRGRVYYNLKNWYRLIRLFPGYEYNSQAMESMMGVKESFSFEEETPPASFLKKWFVELPKLVRLLSRSLWNFIWIKKNHSAVSNQFSSAL